MPTPDIDLAVDGFFRSYAAAFGQGDASAIADHHAYPWHMSSDEGTVSLVAMSSKVEWIEKVESWLDKVRQSGFRSARIADLEVVDLSPLLVQARARWELYDGAGGLLYDFDATYTLGRFGRELRIVQAIFPNERLRYRAFVDSRAAEHVGAAAPEPKLVSKTPLGAFMPSLQHDGLHDDLREEQTARFLEQFAGSEDDSPIVDAAIILANECLASCYSIQALDVLGPRAWTSPTALRYLAGQLRHYGRASAMGQRWALEVSVALHDAIHRALANARKTDLKKSLTSFEDPRGVEWKAAKRPRLEYARILLWSEEDLLDPTATVVVDIHRAFHVPLFFLNTARTARAYDFICFHCAKKDEVGNETRRSMGCINSWHPESESFVLSQFRDGMVRGDASHPARGVLAADLFEEYLTNDDLMFAADAKKLFERKRRPLRAVRTVRPTNDDGASG
jgi:hypothetical protein